MALNHGDFIGAMCGAAVAEPNAAGLDERNNGMHEETEGKSGD